MEFEDELNVVDIEEDDNKNGIIPEEAVDLRRSLLTNNNNNDVATSGLNKSIRGK